MYLLASRENTADTERSGCCLAVLFWLEGNTRFTIAMGKESLNGFVVICRSQSFVFLDGPGFGRKEGGPFDARLVPT